MIKRIACIVLALAVVFGVVSFNATQAWFAAGSKKHQIMTSGEISYTLAGGLKSFSNTKILPDEELVDEPLVLTNSSNIDTQLRVKIVYLRQFSSGSPIEVLYNSSDYSGELTVVMDSSWQRGSDNYYYYLGNSHIVLTTDTTAIPLISSIKFGENTNIAFSNKSSYVKVVIESKQAYYVDWTEIGSV